MATTPVFPTMSSRAGMYESFYLRAVSPEEPLGVWIRHTVHKAPGRAPRGSVWCTVFDTRIGRPFMHKLSSDRLSVPRNGWIAVGEEAWMGPAQAQGRCGEAHWSLSFTTEESELRHLRPDWLYRAPLPRTKLTSPLPAARFEGVLELRGRPSIDLGGWRGMIGHNWGSEHAERWIWLHGVGFDQDHEAWLDVALGRIRLAGRLSPWVANGALSLGSRRQRVGGVGSRGLRVSETPQGCRARLPVEGGAMLEATVEVPGDAAAGWRYCDPDGGGHDVINCSVASVALTLRLADGSERPLRSPHGGVFELGMREQDHGVALAPFPDG